MLIRKPKIKSNATFTWHANSQKLTEHSFAVDKLGL